MAYSFTFDDGTTFTIVSDGNDHWTIFGNGERMVTTGSSAENCLYMVTHQEGYMPEELENYRNQLPHLANWDED